MTTITAEITSQEIQLSALAAKIEDAVHDLKNAKGKGWRKESDASKRLSKLLTRLVNSRLGSELEARIVLYPVTKKDKDDEAKAASQELEARHGLEEKARKQA